eukprot:gene32038-38740_t
MNNSHEVPVTDSGSEDRYSDESKLARRLIIDMNKLLAATGIAAKRIRSLSELARVASSIFVALFEHVYHTRIDEVIREPKTREDYEYNAQLVVDRLGEQINYDLSYITGAQIVDSDVTALANLVDIFTRLLAINVTRSHRSTSTIESEDSRFDELEPSGRRSFSHLLSDPSEESITTSDSMSPPRKDSKLNTSFRSSPIKKYHDTVRYTMEKAEEHLKHEIEQHQARMRRNSQLLWKQAKLQQLNKRKIDRSSRAIQNKRVLDFKQKQEAYRLRCDNEETLLIRRVYEALLREMVKFRREEKKQEKLFASLKLKELEEQLQNVQRIFRERLDVVKEFERQPTYPMESVKQGQSAMQNINRQYAELVRKEEFWSEQCQDKLQCDKRKQYRNLLAMLRAEKWSESLREY